MQTKIRNIGEDSIRVIREISSHSPTQRRTGDIDEANGNLIYTNYKQKRRISNTYSWAKEIEARARGYGQVRTNTDNDRSFPCCYLLPKSNRQSQQSHQRIKGNIRRSPDATQKGNRISNINTQKTVRKSTCRKIKREKDTITQPLKRITGCPERTISKGTLHLGCKNKFNTRNIRRIC